MKLKVILVFCFVFAVSGSNAYSEEASGGISATGSRSIISGWCYAPGDGAGWQTRDFNDSSWLPVSPPATLQAEGGYLWLRSALPVLPLATEEPVHVMLGRLDTACEVYLNGSLIGTRGHFSNPSTGSGYSTAANSPGSILIPRGLLIGAGADILAIRLNAPATTFEIPLLELGDTTAVIFDTRIVAFSILPSIPYSVPSVPS